MDCAKDDFAAARGTDHCLPQVGGPAARYLCRRWFARDRSASKISMPTTCKRKPRIGSIIFSIPPISQYTPLSFWDDLDVYVEAAVEKLDLRNLFEPRVANFTSPSLISRAGAI